MQNKSRITEQEWSQRYLEVLRDLSKEGKEVSLKISGWSMNPFLSHQRDYIYFKKPDRKLKKGDMAFFQRDNGSFAMHRIYKDNKDGTYQFLGDGQSVIENPIRQDQIFGLVNAVKRKGKIITSKNVIWKFYQYVWPVLLPVRGKLVKIAGKLLGR